MQRTPIKQFQQSDIRSCFRLDFSGPSFRLFYKDNSGTYHEIENKADLIHEICFSRDPITEGHPLYIYHRFSHPKYGIIIDKTKDNDIYVEFQKHFFRLEKGLMECFSLNTGCNITIREKFGKSDNYDTYRVLNNYTMSKFAYSVVDGECKLTDKLAEDKWYKFKIGVFETEEHRPEYSDYRSAVFYEKAKIEGEDCTPMANYVCLTSAQKAQIDELVKNFKEKLDEIGAKVYLDIEYDKLAFISSEAKLPENTKYMICDCGDPDKENEVSVPVSAFYIPGDSFMTYLNDCTDVRAVYQKPPQAVTEEK